MARQINVPDYTASERQTKFHTSTAFETMYGGAAGGGKSAAICAEAVTYCLEHPGARVYIFRRTIPELKQSILPEIYKQCADYMNVAHGMKYNGQDRRFEFKNGSTIQLAYLENEVDKYRYQSAEIHLLLFDELTHFLQDEYEYLKTRVRGTGGYPLKVMCATNPGNVGHGWVKSYFIDVAPSETMFTDRQGRTRIFIPAKVSDHVSAEFVKSYTANLQAISDPDLRRALLEGDWDIFAGQAFGEWKREDEEGKPYHVVQPFAIPEHWVKWFAYDWGFNTYAAGTWFARDPSADRIYVYREFYESAMPVSQQAETILMLDKYEQIRMRLADPSIWQHHGSVETGENVAQIFEKSGLIFQPANNDRKAGKNIIHEMLAPAADGLPRLQVFSSCTNTIRTIPALPYDKNKPEDIDTRAEDHLYDAWRYGLINQRPAQTPKIRYNQNAINARNRYIKA
jgi:phage terminase large subunit